MCKFSLIQMESNNSILITKIIIMSLTECTALCLSNQNLPKFWA